MGSKRPTLSVRRRPLVVPEPGQRVRLRAGRGQWRASFRAVSEPYTDEVGEIVVWVAKEGEYREAVREGRRPVGIPWPVRHIEVVSLLEDGEERTREAQERAEPRSAGEGAQEPRESSGMHMPEAGGGPLPRDQQRPSERPWWRRMF